MIDPAIRILELDPREWSNLVRFVTTPAPVERPGRPAPTGGLVLLHEGESVIKAVHTERGRLTGIAYAGPRSLKELAHAQGARWVVALEVGALDEAMHRGQERVRIDQDLVTQNLEFVHVVRELFDEGRIAIYPRPLAGLPLPRGPTVQRALDLAFPDDRTAVVYLFEDGRIWTSLIVRKSRGQIDLVAGHRALAMSDEPRDYLRDYPRILGAVRARFAAPAIGFFAERRTVERLFSDDRPGVWARAYAAKQIVVDPLAPWAGLALGAGAVREAFDRSRKLLSRIDPLGLAQPLARRAREKLAATIDLAEILGFDPFDLVSRLRKLRDE
ncbi:MAG: hypothetical protein HYY06_25185 [Deltaproteobacteria bacterium]|nr:hypothetical protein [Deltaproteobacteria bacterium]